MESMMIILCTLNKYVLIQLVETRAGLTQLRNS